MKALASHYERETFSVYANAPVREAADLMRAKSVGSIVVLGDTGLPLGMLTDRDLLERVIAERRDAGETRATDVMSKPLHVASPDDPLDDVVQVMAKYGVRRVPIVRDGKLVGIVSLDDVLAEVADELHDLAEGRRRAVSLSERAARARELMSELGDRAREIGEELDGLAAETRETLSRELEGLRDRIRARRN
jgi:CBS domain-containing protein